MDHHDAPASQLDFVGEGLIGTAAAAPRAVQVLNWLQVGAAPQGTAPQDTAAGGGECSFLVMDSRIWYWLRLRSLGRIPLQGRILSSIVRESPRLHWLIARGIC